MNLAKLPNADSFFGYEEEEIATALGSVCHVLFLVSKYLDVRQPPTTTTNPFTALRFPSIQPGVFTCGLYPSVGFVQVPLRYPILPMCSRSAIWDEISINGIFTYAEAHIVPCLSFISLCGLTLHDPPSYHTLENTRSTLVASIKRALTSASSSSTRTWNRFVLTPTAAKPVCRYRLSSSAGMLTAS